MLRFLEMLTIYVICIVKLEKNVSPKYA